MQKCRVLSDGWPGRYHQDRYECIEEVHRNVNLGGTAEVVAFVPWGMKAFFYVFMRTLSIPEKSKEEKMKKQGMKFLGLLLAGIFLLTGCQSASDLNKESTQKSEKSAQAPVSQDQGQQERPLAEGKYTVGISQFAQHESLDNCRNGFIKGLADEGLVEGKNLTILYENSNAETAAADQIAKDFVSKKVDLIAAVATPSAMYAFTETEGKEIPVVYVAVNDPVFSGFAHEDGTSTGNITGTSDALPIEAQLKMMRKILPDAKKLGILYTTSETNSESNVKKYQALAPKYGFELYASGIAAAADIPMAADDLLNKVDCITNITDNTVVNQLPMILQKAQDKKIPVFGSEIEQVKKGCLAAEGIEYIDLGELTGKMAAKILKGEKAAKDLPFQVIDKPYLYINTEVAKNLGITLDGEYVKTAEKVLDTIDVGAKSESETKK